MITEIKTIEDIVSLLLAGETDWEKYGKVYAVKCEDLTLFNYLPQAMFGNWNFFETVARGLIINHTTGEIVARPFDKFFNWLQGGRKASGHIVAVTEKLDGSMGVLYRQNGDKKIATRGSFGSEQALWATNFLNTYFDLADLPDELTLIFEIIYPENRVVVDYKGREDLVLLAARNRHTGQYLNFFEGVVPLAQKYGFTLPKVYSFNDITSIIALCGEISGDEEGFVVEFSDGQRFKFKGDRYLELHKLISNISFRNTVRAYMSGSLSKWLETLPDEFLQPVQAWRSEIETYIVNRKREIDDAFGNAPVSANRRTYAEWVHKNHPEIKSYLFSALDGKDIMPMIFEELLSR